MNRRRLLAAMAAAGLVLPVRALAAARFDRGLLWRVSAPGAAPSHVFGTLHAEDPRLATFPAPVDEAFGSSRSLMLEYFADPYSRQRFLEAALYPDGRTLADDIGEADFERAVQALQPIGLPREFMLKLKPWAVLLNLRISRQPTGGEPPESQLYRRARERRMPVSTIENVEEQIFTFDEMSRDAQIALLRHFLDHPAELDALAEHSLGAYQLGDLAALWEAQQDFVRKYPALRAYHAELMKRVVLDRSVVMAFRMQRELRRGRAFIAVGALHLYGERGLLALLEADGYRADRMY
ncbi:MAG TPA: TraB/GumN family protein [Burkholderiales bacterium]|nr:TraB/GumN family protein [Burkholderiales bacterium]